MEQTGGMKQKVISGLSWKLKERILAQGISQFVIAPILARLLLPEEYGNVAMAMVVINLMAIFVGSSFSDTLIQKKDATDTDFSTMLICSMSIAIVLYVILYAAAPWICSLYDNQGLVPILRLLCLHLPLLSLNTIIHAYVSRKMMFKKFFYSTLASTLVSSTLVIAMAATGCGEYALVAQFLTNTAVDTIALLISVRWFPKLKFSLASAKSMFSYGWELTAALFLNKAYTSLRDFVIGRFYSPADLAYYNKGNNLPSTTVTNIDNSMTGVLFPALSSTNGDREKLKVLTSKSIETSAYVIFPMMLGMFAVAETLITLWLSDTWIECVPFLRVCCIYWMLEPIKSANCQAVKALGRSDIYLKLQFIRIATGISLVLLTMRISVLAVVASNIAQGLIACLICIYPNRKMIGYGYLEQLKDTIGPLLMSIVMAAVVWLEYWMLGTAWWVLFLQAFTGVVVYVGLSVVTKNKTFFFLLRTLRGGKGGQKH